MKVKLENSSSFIQVLLDMYMYRVVINKSCKQSLVANTYNNMSKNSNLNLA